MCFVSPTIIKQSTNTFQNACGRTLFCFSRLAPRIDVTIARVCCRAHCSSAVSVIKPGLPTLLRLSTRQALRSPPKKSLRTTESHNQGGRRNTRRQACDGWARLNCDRYALRIWRLSQMRQAKTRKKESYKNRNTMSKQHFYKAQSDQPEEWVESG